MLKNKTPEDTELLTPSEETRQCEDPGFLLGVCEEVIVINNGDDMPTDCMNNNCISKVIHVSLEPPEEIKRIFLKSFPLVSVCNDFNLL